MTLWRTSGIGRLPVPPRRVHGAQAPTEQIRILMTPRLKEAIKRAADQAGLHMSEFVLGAVKRLLAREAPEEPIDGGA